MKNIAWVVVMLFLLVGVASAANYTARPTTTATITTIPTDAWNGMIDVFGGYDIPTNESEARPNATGFAHWVLFVYSDPIGSIAYVILCSIPFILMWIMQSDFVPAIVAGIITGAFLLLYLPAEFTLICAIFVAMGLTTVVFRLLSQR